jgi:hypothetical protein
LLHKALAFPKMRTAVDQSTRRKATFGLAPPWSIFAAVAVLSPMEAHCMTSYADEQGRVCSGGNSIAKLEFVHDSPPMACVLAVDSSVSQIMAVGRDPPMLMQSIQRDAYE